MLKQFFEKRGFMIVVLALKHVKNFNILIF